MEMLLDTPRETARHMMKRMAASSTRSGQRYPPVEVLGRQTDNAEKILPDPDRLMPSVAT